MNFRSSIPVLACALALAACGKPPARPQPTPEAGYVVIKTEAQALTTELPGRTSPLAISEVRPQVNGIILERLFTEGSTVRKGQSLYRIDPAPYRAAVDQAKAQLASVQANMATVKVKSERYADLVKVKAVSQQDYDDAQAAYRQAQAGELQAKAALQTAEINLGYTDIKAPISGRIGVSAITQGALATAGQAGALTTIQTLDPIYVDVTQSSAELLRLERDIRNGLARKDAPLAARVRLTLEDGSVYPLEGKLQFTDVTVDPNSGAVTIRAVFPNPQGMLLPGMFVRARLNEAMAPDAILVPQQGVSRDPKGGATVLVVNGQNKAELRSIEIGQAVGPNWLATKGLKAGDRVIVEGLQRIQAGATVRPVPAGSAPSRPAGGPPRRGGGKP
ncbi:MAG: efflux RND transporter periplasmic adaptor subunit [Caulobacteraceae bacterium]